MNLEKYKDGFLTWEHVAIAQSEDWDTICLCYLEYSFIGGNAAFLALECNMNSS